MEQSTPTRGNHGGGRIMKREDWLFAIGLASLIGSAYVMKLVKNKEREKQAQKTTAQQDSIGCVGEIKSGYIEAYKEAIKKWFSYINYKGDKRSKYYKILRDKAETAKEFLWETPSGENLPNFSKISSLYYDLDITSADEMIDYIFK